ncbi:hypothetical protein IF188_10905 [Microbacterium sp. NEAU-LLC]|uniref:Uncharacterized protein n=1 Tax=Microbacterium helvum TaxID=2773713 RepID=A0ABR8NNJ1_9MICO|nr:hypothetical protein [Microbacterium helvum]MBD3942204.1 hypothetical protein [Microbacterium helvum]
MVRNEGWWVLSRFGWHSSPHRPDDPESYLGWPSFAVDDSRGGEITLTPADVVASEYVATRVVVEDVVFSGGLIVTEDGTPVREAVSSSRCDRWLELWYWGRGEREVAARFPDAVRFDDRASNGGVLLRRRLCDLPSYEEVVQWRTGTASWS